MNFGGLKNVKMVKKASKLIKGGNNQQPEKEKQQHTAPQPTSTAESQHASSSLDYRTNHIKTLVAFYQNPENEKHLSNLLSNMYGAINDPNVTSSTHPSNASHPKHDEWAQYQLKQEEDNCFMDSYPPDQIVPVISLDDETYHDCSSSDPSPSNSVKPEVITNQDNTFQSVQAKPSIALIGNPGTGKSTILNGLVHETFFKSGESAGSGLTVNLKANQVGNTLYYDTPGLDDIKRRKEAGKEIDTLLAKNDPLKIVFVVTLMSGRVRPEDSTTISLVLDCLENVGNDENTDGRQGMNNRFAVVINKVSEDFIQEMDSNLTKRQQIHSSLTGSRSTKFWHYIKFDIQLLGKNNTMIRNEHLEQLIDAMDVTRRAGDFVRPINTATFEDRKEILARREEELHNKLNEIKQSEENLKIHMEEGLAKAEEKLLNETNTNGNKQSKDKSKA